MPSATASCRSLARWRGEGRAYGRQTGEKPGEPCCSIPPCIGRGSRRTATCSLHPVMWMPPRRLGLQGVTSSARWSRSGSRRKWRWPGGRPCNCTPTGVAGSPDCARLDREYGRHAWRGWCQAAGRRAIALSARRPWRLSGGEVRSCSCRSVRWAPVGWREIAALATGSGSDVPRGSVTQGRRVRALCGAAWGTDMGAKPETISWSDRGSSAPLTGW